MDRPEQHDDGVRHEPLTPEEISEGEDIAIPGGDITHALTESIDDLLEKDPDEEKKPDESPKGDEQHEKRHLFHRHRSS